MAERPCPVDGCDQKGRHCSRCLRRIYLVQDAAGRPFYVGLDGTVWCR